MEEKTPFVPKEIVDHLKNTYTTRHLLNTRTEIDNADQLVGFMVGVTHAISYLEALTEGED